VNIGLTASAEAGGRERTGVMTSMLPALMGALVGAGLYVAFDLRYLSRRRAAPSVARRPRRP
jgi:uncharacterized membrane protein YeaQ/YmgE (transglycosylase-associated protein family)